MTYPRESNNATDGDTRLITPYEARWNYLALFKSILLGTNPDVSIDYASQTWAGIKRPKGETNEILTLSQADALGVFSDSKPSDIKIDQRVVARFDQLPEVTLRDQVIYESINFEVSQQCILRDIHAINNSSPSDDDHNIKMIQYDRAIKPIYDATFQQIISLLPCSMMQMGKQIEFMQQQWKQIEEIDKYIQTMSTEGDKFNLNQFQQMTQTIPLLSFSTQNKAAILQSLDRQYQLLVSQQKPTLKSFFDATRRKQQSQYKAALRDAFLRILKDINMEDREAVMSPWMANSKKLNIVNDGSSLLIKSTFYNQVQDLVSAHRRLGLDKRHA